LKTVTFVNGGDAEWHGLYVDGVLKLQNSSFDYDELFKALGFKFEESSVDEKWLAERGCEYPPVLGDVPSE